MRMRRRERDRRWGSDEGRFRGTDGDAGCGVLAGEWVCIIVYVVMDVYGCLWGMFIWCCIGSIVDVIYVVWCSIYCVV